jgi:hypothetical protein
LGEGSTQASYIGGSHADGLGRGLPHLTCPGPDGQGGFPGGGELLAVSFTRKGKPGRSRSIATLSVVVKLSTSARRPPRSPMRALTAPIRPQSIRASQLR